MPANEGMHEGDSGGWNPCREVERRRENVNEFPYCLFTAYFANVYFGLRQAMEIDGLRYAIGRLADERDRQWAMGALIASVSALGTTFGGHFAQPVVRRLGELSVGGLGKVVEMRAASITHEFCARYVELAAESERASYAVEIVPGPWEAALEAVQAHCGEGEKVVVYVDAPYTREEYSRYYHVLETLVRYHYPDSVGIGRVPSKLHGGRFRSEFFTRSREGLVKAFCAVISEVLRKDWVCVWSYSDGGDAEIPRVVDEVRVRIACDIRSYRAPYTHKALGAAGAKSVIEHIVVFCRK